MKADGSIKQNGGVLNIAFIPPFVVSDDAEEQVSIDKTSRVRAGLWKEASRFDWDSRSRILQLLFIMAAFCATLTGWMGSSDVHSHETILAIWKRFADPSFCTSAMYPEHTSSPQDIRQGWEIAVKVIKSKVAELYHDKEKPIPPRLRRWGRQTEFAVRLTDVQNRTVSWCAQLVQEMCLMTYDHLSRRFRGWSTPFLKQIARQAEVAYAVLLEREIGIALDQSPNWKDGVSEEKILRAFGYHCDSNGSMKRISKNSSASAVLESEKDEAQNTHSEHDHECMDVDTDERKHDEQGEVLSPISPDMDTFTDTKSNKRGAGASLQPGSSDRNNIKVCTDAANTEDRVDGSDENSGVPSPKKRIREGENEARASKFHNYAEDVSDFDDAQLNQNAQVQSRSNSSFSHRVHGREDRGWHGDKRGAPDHQENKDRLQVQKSFENHVVNGDQLNAIGGVHTVIDPPKKKARTQLQHNGYFCIDKDTGERAGQGTRERSNDSHKKHRDLMTIGDPDGFELQDTSAVQSHENKPLSTNIDDPIAEEPREKEATDSRHKRIVERIAIQVRNEVLLRRQKGDMVESHGKHIIVPPRKRPQYRSR